jgi:hypothetical protein
MEQTSSSPNADLEAPNGSAWAALVAAGIGGAVFGVITDISEISKPAAKALAWYKPAGALSGVAICAVLVWGVAWALLHARWRSKRLARQGLLTTVTVLLSVVAIVTTFPPFYELLGG